MRNAFVPCLLAIVVSSLSGCDEYLLERLRDPSVDNVNLANAAAAPATPVGSLPTGSVTYDGVVAASTAGDFVGSLYADMSMNVNFGSGGITGTIDNADLVDDFTGDVVQNLSGSLTMTGTENNGFVSANATGALIGTGGLVTGTSTVGLALLGNVRTDVAAGDTVYGVMTGGVTGDFDLTLSAGEFYGSN